MCTLLHTHTILQARLTSLCHSPLLVECAGGVQPGDGQLQLGAGLGVLPHHEARGAAAQHPLLQRREHTQLLRVVRLLAQTSACIVAWTSATGTQRLMVPFANLL